MHENHGIVAFRKAILDLISPIIQQHSKSPDGKLQKVDRSSLSQKERTRLDVAHHFIEITSSLERLREIATLLRFAPPRSAKVSRVSYLRLLMELYIQELYVLEQRLLSFAKWTERRLSRSKRNSALQASRMAKATKHVFNGKSGIRSRHVHRLRFDTEELNNLSMFELVATHSSEKETEAPFKKNADLAYKLARRNAVTEVRHELAQVLKYVNSYLSIMYGLVFSDLLQTPNHKSQ